MVARWVSSSKIEKSMCCMLWHTAAYPLTPRLNRRLSLGMERKESPGNQTRQRQQAKILGPPLHLPYSRRYRMPHPLSGHNRTMCKIFPLRSSASRNTTQQDRRSEAEKMEFNLVAVESLLSMVSVVLCPPLQYPQLKLRLTLTAK